MSGTAGSDSGEHVPGAEPHAQHYARYRRALEDEELPAALLDLDALDCNLERLAATVSGSSKTLRLATKSLRCVELLRYLLERGEGALQGLMTYTAAETEFLFAQGFDDLLLAYPTVQPADLARLCELAGAGATAAVVVDSPLQLELLDQAARDRGVRVGVVIDVDMSLRALGGLIHLGVRRSPLREPAEVLELATRVERSAGLAFRGLLAYEAQIAGLPDASPFSPWLNLPKRIIKWLSRGYVRRTRAALLRCLEQAGLRPPVFNGGGTGSLGSCSSEEALTEVTAGSGFLGSHLFDYYRELTLVPAAYFAVQVVRRPAANLVTCHGGGLVASGEAGPDRLPVPALPPGLRMLPMEGAGEVQTPLRVPSGVLLQAGDPVFWRHAKAGELAEHFNEYLLVRGDEVQGRWETYRGQGRCFLG